MKSYKINLIAEENVCLVVTLLENGYYGIVEGATMSPIGSTYAVFDDEDGTYICDQNGSLDMFPRAEDAWDYLHGQGKYVPRMYFPQLRVGDEMYSVIDASTIPLHIYNYQPSTFELEYADM